MDTNRDNWFRRARAASGMTDDECARVLRVDEETFRELDEFPGRLTVRDLSLVCRALDAEGRSVVRAAMLPMMR